jgi:AraC-like DNA-binding protein
MGYALHIVENLPPPFDRVHEQAGLIPEGKHLPVFNPVRKIIFVLSGEFWHEVPGMGGPLARLQMRPGDIFVMPLHGEQRYRSLEPGAASRFHAIRLAFSPEVYPALPLALPAPAAWDHGAATRDGDEALIARCLSGFAYLPDGQDEAIQQTLSQLREEARRRQAGYRTRVYGLCLGLTMLVARKVAAQPAPVAVPVERSPADYHIARVKEFLLHHREQDICLERVAEHAQLSREHVARLFKQSTGMTVFEYLRQARIDLAKTYLASTDRNLSEIARMTGFSSLTVFSRTFRREVGVTPSEFRQQVADEIG